MNQFYYVMLVWLVLGFAAYRWGEFEKKKERARIMRCNCRKCMELKEHMKSYEKC